MKKNVSQRPIMIVEDLDFDFEVARRGLQRLGVPAPIIRHHGVGEAVSFLRSRRDLPETGLPSIIVLDLLLADGDGFELLQHVREDDFLRKIPVVIWSASSDPKMVESCYRRGANSYIQKAADVEVTNLAIERFVSYWLQTVTLPASDS